MNKEDAVLLYKTSIAIFKNWAATGLISDDELLTIEPMIAKKYCLSLSSIYRENRLISSPNRAIYSSTKEGAHGTDSNKGRASAARTAPA